MQQGIREASVDDAASVAGFFSSIFEDTHGAGSSSALEMLQRTVAVLFPPSDAEPTVYVYEHDGTILGVVAAARPDSSGVSQLLTIQVFDNVQGRGIAQTLLGRVIDHVRQWGAVSVATQVPYSDVRARGFLRREGFSSSGELPELPGPDTTVEYTLDLASPSV